MACLVFVEGYVMGARPAVAATPFGWLFDSPEHRRRPARHRRGAAPQPQAVIPLPVPRPSFPGDARPADATATHPPTTESPAPQAGPVSPPLPPERPAALAPGVPAPVQPDEAIGPAASPPIAPKPLETKPLGPKPSEAKPIETRPAGAQPANPAAPGVAPSGAKLGEVPRQPEDDTTCPGRLKARNVAAEPVQIGPQPDSRCTVVEAVRLTGLTMPDGGRIDFPDGPTIACTTADAFSHYVRDLLVPLAKGTFGSPVAAVWTGPGLECRSRDHIFGAKLSAHGQGLAVDIAQLKLADGRLIEVGQPKTPADQGFETAARAAGCGYFHTVLGPGSDSYHRTHWHFDLEVRGAKGDSKFCK